MNDTAARFFMDFSGKAYANPKSSECCEHWDVAECYEESVTDDDLRNAIIVGEVFNEFKEDNILPAIKEGVGIEKLYEAIYVWAAGSSCGNNFMAQRFLDLASSLPTAQMVTYLVRVLAHQNFAVYVTALGFYISFVVMNIRLKV